MIKYTLFIIIKWIIPTPMGIYIHVECKKTHKLFLNIIKKTIKIDL